MINNIINSNNERSSRAGVPKDTLILGEGRYYSKDCYKTQLNNNVIVVGTSGAGKTRSIVIPNLLQASGSYVVSDPKGNLYKKMGPYLRSKGYDVKAIDFIHPEKSSRYNPLKYCKTTTDIRKLAHMIAYNDAKIGNKEDPFWDESTEMLYLALIGYVLESDAFSEEEKNMATVRKLICLANRTGSSARREISYDSRLSDLLNRHKNEQEMKGKQSWAYDRFNEYNTSPEKTHQTTNMNALTKIVCMATEEVEIMLKGNDIDFENIGQKPTALFVMVSDTDRSLDVLVNMFYTQLMNILCTYADDHCKDSRLPVSVQFILDDFATNARIDNFENMISNIRSRGISAMIMVQSEAQLYAGYGESAQTIIDNCNTYVYMGGSDPNQAKKITYRANKPLNRILNMPLSTSWIFRRGEEPVFCNNFDLVGFEKEKGLNRVSKVFKLESESDRSTQERKEEKDRVWKDELTAEEKEPLFAD